MRLVTDCMQIYDNMHRFIKVSNYAQIIIHTPYFQRLRELHQLGACYMVWPTANHTRFEHSIGTYYLAGRLLRCVKENTPQENIDNWLSGISELSTHLARKKDGEPILDDYLTELIKIAALCHDLGHGPFSHSYDDLFVGEIENIKGKRLKNKYHEGRSCIMLREIIKESELCDIISDGEIQFMCDIIDPKPHNNGFVYQIVSNNLNTLDVDKYDYIVRDCKNVGLEFSIDYSRFIDDICIVDNIICYPQQIYIDILNLFMARYRLHKQIYMHKAVVGMQHMISRMLIDLNDHFPENFDDNMKQFSLLTDWYVTKMPQIINHRESLDVLDRLSNRDIYKHIHTFVSLYDIDINESTFGDTDGIYVFNRIIGFVGGDKKNPVKSVYFYDKKLPYNDRKPFKINNSDMTHLYPHTYQEHIVMVFLTDRKSDRYDEIKKKCEELAPYVK